MILRSRYPKGNASNSRNHNSSRVLKKVGVWSLEFGTSGSASDLVMRWCFPTQLETIFSNSLQSPPDERSMIDGAQVGLGRCGLPFEMDSTNGPASALGASFLVLVIALPVATNLQATRLAPSSRPSDQIRSARSRSSGIWYLGRSLSLSWRQQVHFVFGKLLWRSRLWVMSVFSIRQSRSAQQFTTVLWHV